MVVSSPDESRKVLLSLQLLHRHVTEPSTCLLVNMLFLMYYLHERLCVCVCKEREVKEVGRVQSGRGKGGWEGAERER